LKNKNELNLIAIRYSINVAINNWAELNIISCIRRLNYPWVILISSLKILFFIKKLSSKMHDILKDDFEDTSL